MVVFDLLGIVLEPADGFGSRGKPSCLVLELRAAFGLGILLSSLMLSLLLLSLVDGWTDCLAEVGLVSSTEPADSNKSST